MVISLVNNLYPPIVMDVLPAFIRTSTCRIYFSLSMYNAAADIKNVQISITNQKTNKTALKYSKYPSGIKLSDLYYDGQQSGDYKYYVDIFTSDLQEGVFGLNQFYKVQLRLTSINASNISVNQGALATWIYNNLDYFSEWSTICLIKGIDQPHISLNGLTQNSQTTLSVSPVDISGRLYYENSSLQEEHLNNYRIQVYHGGLQSSPIYETKQIYTTSYAPNQINCAIAYDFSPSLNYFLVISYTTNNLYEGSSTFGFTISESIVDPMNANISTEVDEENGRVAVKILSNQGTTFTGTFVIRRSSSRSNFTLWEDIKKITYNSNVSLNYTWYDMTIEGGIWYKYRAQKINSTGSRGTPIQIQDPVMCVFEDIFLTKGNIQLKVQFNPTLGQFKYNVTESQQNTLGSQFPFIKRNGNNFYRTFSLGGLITAFSDLTNWYDPHYVNGIFETDKNENKLFASRSELYGQSKYLYDDYNENNNINDYKDFIYERAFRQKVYDFLYKDDVKLFRSTTEGNILIRLMNISFQPVEALGRTLYSFTASAVQLDKADYDNYIKYGIINQEVN